MKKYSFALLAAVSLMAECSPLGTLNLGKLPTEIINVKAESCASSSCYHYHFTMPYYDLPWVDAFVWQKSFGRTGFSHPEYVYEEAQKISDARSKDQQGLGRDGWSEIEKHGNFLQLFHCQTHLIPDPAGESLLSEPMEKKTYYVFSTKTKKQLQISNFILPQQKAALQELLAEKYDEDSEGIDFLSPSGWFFDHGKLVFQFSTQQLNLPDYDEPIEIPLPARELSKIISPELLKAAKADWQPTTGNCLIFDEEQ